ncbi:HAMP domain-containing protein [Paenibacillus sp. LMG 31456]|uniref:Signal transduction histidine-protein kinase ArlS n=1 Tax=Paenibacillus foliorum TaxID=2654974 RepID=A0A972K149_9BACL|nr:ATP-binding protein [Paenibacillus foliorum]NOU92392.1 HAMP domain-containing protein [Paenibacillus foliorum]
MMKFTGIPIKWKLMIGSFIFLIVLFFAYNAAQYIVINHWLLNQTEEEIRKDMDEIQGYFIEKQSDAKDIANANAFIEKLVKNNQLIRILNNEGIPILTVSNELPEDWVDPKTVLKPELSRIWHFDDHLIIMRSPFKTSNFVGTVEIINNLEALDKLNDNLNIVMLSGGMLAILLSGLGGLLLTRQLLKPIQSIIVTMKKIMKNGLQERVVFHDNRDELSYLAILFNEMMGQLEKSFRQQKQFVEDASHELRTPISIIEGYLSLLNRWGKEDPKILDESLSAAMKETTRLRKLVQELLELSQVDSIKGNEIKEYTDPRPIIQQLVNDLSILHPDFKFILHMNKFLEGHLIIPSHHLKQIVLIVLDNAVKYSLHDKTIEINVSTLQNNTVNIQIVDQGIGIPEEDLPFVFDRFYRVDKARSRKQGGSGLGLAIAKRIAHTYHGDIIIRNNENKGISVTISLPFISEI